MNETIELIQGYGLPVRSKYPFSQLRVNDAFKTDDLTKYSQIRSAASRQGKSLKRVFTVRKVTEKDKKTGAVVKKIAVIRVK